MKMKAYATNRESHAAWLGHVPDHWEVKRLKYVFPILRSGVSVNSEKSPAGEDAQGILKTSCVYGNRFRPEENKRVLESDLSRLACPVTKNSLIISRMNTPELVGSCGFVSADYPNLFLPDRLWIARFGKSRKMDARFAWYLVTSHLFASLTASLATGTSDSMKNLTQEAFLGIDAPIPGLPEQLTIVQFLDLEVGRIDQLVKKKRDLIERLKEKRSALISRTVTRGLPPKAACAAGLPENPPLKETAIEWLGQVPEHWTVEQLKWAIMFQRGHDLPTDEREDGRYPLITSAGPSTRVVAAAAKGPGIVTGRYGTIGAFYLIEEDYWPLNTTLYSVDLRGNHPKFLLYMLNHLAPLFLVNAAKSAVPGVDRNDIHPTETAVPPLPEQIAISDFLDKETAKLDILSEQVEKAIERLQEYRAALINAAVTGKIDVRKAIA